MPSHRTGKTIWKTPRVLTALGLSAGLGILLLIEYGPRLALADALLLGVLLLCAGMHLFMHRGHGGHGGHGGGHREAADGERQRAEAGRPHNGRPAVAVARRPEERAGRDSL